MASHGQGESVCLPPPLLPSSISPHNLSPPSRIWLESLSSRACLGFNKSLYQEQVGGLCVYLQVICKHEVLKTHPWICSAWGVLPIPHLNRQICSMAKRPPVCQRSHPTHRPGACDKCLHFWLSTRSCGKNRLFTWVSCIKKIHFNLKLQTSSTILLKKCSIIKMYCCKCDLASEGGIHSFHMMSEFSAAR